MASRTPSKKQLLKAAILLAEKKDWESVHMHDIASQFGISLVQLEQIFPEKDDLVDAWFANANHEMLAASRADNFMSMRPRERVSHLVMTWLSTLGEHKNVTKQMLGGKFEPGHIHVLFPSLRKLGKTVSWIREAACLDDVYLQRLISESVLSTIFVSTLFAWLIDDDATAKSFLDSSLAMAESSTNMLTDISASLIQTLWPSEVEHRHH